MESNTPTIDQLLSAREWLDQFEGNPDESNYQDLTIVSLWLTEQAASMRAERDKPRLKKELSGLLKLRNSVVPSAKTVTKAFKLWKEAFVKNSVEDYKIARKNEEATLRKEYERMSFDFGSEEND
jgi:hypothetical protein